MKSYLEVTPRTQNKDQMRGMKKIGVRVFFEASGQNLVEPERVSSLREL
jgi:hypothetical protein